MMDEKKDGGPAFPQAIDHPYADKGMSLRAYAAIQLRQPNSGIDWLDDMIRNARRDDLAGQALMGLLSTMETDHPFYKFPTRLMASLSCDYADAMLAVREVRG
jgi:hypothetical protein